MAVPPDSAIDLDAFARDLEAAYPHPRDRHHLPTIVSAVRRTPALHQPHAVAATQSMVRAGCKASSLVSTIVTAGVALRHPTLADVPLGIATASHFDEYFEAREPSDPNYRRGSMNRPPGSTAPWIPHDKRPLTRPDAHAVTLNVFLTHAGVDVRCDPQGQRLQVGMDDIKWRSHTELQRVLVACGSRLEDLALLAALSVGLQWSLIGGLRCSDVRRIRGRCYLIGPHGRLALLGPYAYPLELLKEHRISHAEKGADPYLFWAPFTTNEPLLAVQLHKHVVVLAQRAGFHNGITPNIIQTTGHAALLAYGLGSDYLHFLCPETPLKTLDRLWGIVDDVAGTPQNLGIGSPKTKGLPPFTVPCECGAVRFQMPDSCPQCPARVNRDALDRAAFLEADLHRQITEILKLRGETTEDRERLALAQNGGDEQ